jgi:exonuclease III
VQGSVGVILNKFFMDLGNFIIWNVQRLNSRAWRDVVHELVASERSSVVCLQETMLDVISIFDIMKILGMGFEYAYLPAVQTQGSIPVACHSMSWIMTNTSTTSFTVSAKFRAAIGGQEWWLTIVYGPCTDEGKLAFLAELCELVALLSKPWLLCSDFNMVYKAEDKSNGHVNKRLMGAIP